MNYLDKLFISGFCDDLYKENTKNNVICELYDELDKCKVSLTLYHNDFILFDNYFIFEDEDDISVCRKELEHLLDTYYTLNKYDKFLQGK